MRSSIVASILLFVALCKADGEIYMCDSEVYCKGGEESILDTLLVKHRDIFNDSKSFVDSTLKFEPGEVLKNFASIDKTSLSDVQQFYADNFNLPGNELLSCTPSDWSENPQNFGVITDPRYKQFALDLNKIWKDLCRKMKPDLEPTRHSLLPLPHEFIAPGDRFREPYYWDTYWIIKGLLVSGMNVTAQKMILNLATMCERYGFVPNGGRIYYLKRSQPPFLTWMVYDYITYTGHYDFLDVKVINKTLLEVLVVEYDYWTKNAARTVEVGGKTYTLYSYVTESNTPRPESYDKDVETASNTAQASKPRLYNNIARTAASGLDFSCKWLTSCDDLSSSVTDNIAPVELNSYICHNAQLLQFFFSRKGEATKAAAYNVQADQMMSAMRNVFWDSSTGIWLDYRLDTGKHSINTYLTSMAPVFTNCYNAFDTGKVRRAYAYLEKKGMFGHPNGVPFGIIPNGQQWDFPMAWPNMMHLLIESLRRSRNPIDNERAYRLAEKWIENNYLTYMNTGFMFEKYDVTFTNHSGPGRAGEYETQKGFGWTNGVVLDLLYTYGGRLTAPAESTTKATVETTTKSGATLSVSIFLVMLFTVSVSLHPY